MRVRRHVRRPRRPIYDFDLPRDWPRARCGAGGLPRRADAAGLGPALAGLDRRRSRGRPRRVRRAPRRASGRARRGPRSRGLAEPKPLSGSPGHVLSAPSDCVAGAAWVASAGRWSACGPSRRHDEERQTRRPPETTPPPTMAELCRKIRRRRRRATKPQVLAVGTTTETEHAERGTGYAWSTTWTRCHVGQVPAEPRTRPAGLQHSGRPGRRRRSRRGRTGRRPRPRGRGSRNLFSWRRNQRQPSGSAHPRSRTVAAFQSPPSGPASARPGHAARIALMSSQQDALNSTTRN